MNLYVVRAAFITGDWIASKSTSMTWIASLVIILWVVGAYGLIHSLLASLPVKAWVRRSFGPAVDRSYRLLYNIFAVVTLLPVLALVAALPGRTLYGLPVPWSWLALGVQLFAFLVMALGLLQTDVWSFLGLRQIVEPPTSGNPKMKITGLYRFVRHPQYTAGLLFIWATPVMTSNMLALYAGWTVYIMIGVHHEEHRLRCEYGEAYRAYMRSTPMLLPHPRRARADPPRQP